MSTHLATIHDADPMDPGGLLSPDQVAKRLMVSRSMVYKLVRTGELPVIYVGRLPRFADADVLSFIASRRRSARVSP